MKIIANRIVQWTIVQIPHHRDRFLSTTISFSMLDYLKKPVVSFLESDNKTVSEVR